MSLTDMKITKADEKAEKAKRDKNMKSRGPSLDSSGGYPHGLGVRLDDLSLNKLGLDALPKVGKKYTLTATVVVTEARANLRNGEQVDRHVSFQIQKMDLGAGSVTDALDEVM